MIQDYHLIILVPIVKSTVIITPNETKVCGYVQTQYIDS